MPIISKKYYDVELSLKKLAEIAGIPAIRGFRKNLAKKFDIPETTLYNWIKHQSISADGLYIIENNGYPADKWLVSEEDFLAEKKSGDRSKKVHHHMIPLTSEERDLIEGLRVLKPSRRMTVFSQATTQFLAGKRELKKREKDEKEILEKVIKTLSKAIHES